MRSTGGQPEALLLWPHRTETLPTHISAGARYPNAKHAGLFVDRGDGDFPFLPLRASAFGSSRVQMDKRVWEIDGFHAVALRRVSFDVFLLCIGRPQATRWNGSALLSIHSLPIK